ncbi:MULTISPECIES: L-serine ammonia-lyase, iron-sulfur-dependent subunit beta [unclassified Staphylococcus]|uniref:L-serine ammonia-lyase, iron-sulfur-dependent subunit beta n=1 Tax=unclassified Staphylococcus TaxID=91994 RepID=UPI0021D0359C|nr:MULTISPECIES: L-serine ammonia-lyase, iron-sulfur-dependent subunit beta [unclassified Staphylococcus]UXR70360.1 L-serine ammonia-lyase, iron-sulfur-dependent subunit beta [Staphylococcus sp. IVB6246]UXR72426.1 L-serine ammonia-lyase, iron-sulfur-dependent subunit beta [Staphylococcus sp. IVB6240]UXR74729.1 L-serine ammonia-lyase, iron-sulfur-dependent subunit beta [Staphylococcus sp. IVB6238]UXR77063.1 L-serine ammonia-lyase, iron-sulfur-dependent subunit beta [Staphylococcus sp. IVB6233]U
MKFKSIFDIIGPTMVGPSSSHTAGAVRIGLVARSLFGGQPAQADIYLFGSFMETYKGHGTDVALVGGLLGYDTDDSRIETSLETANELGMRVNFIEMSEDRSHPNTAIIDMTDGETTISVEGVSIGGGKIEIVAINGFPINISGNYPTLLVFHKDTFGTIGKVANILGVNSINVGSMHVSRKEKGDQALMTCELDESISDEMIEEIRDIPGIITVSLMGED